MDAKRREKEEGAQPSTFQITKPIEDISQYMPAVPLVAGQHYPCNRCHAPLNYLHGPPSTDRRAYPASWEPVAGIVRGSYQVCDICFSTMLLTGTIQGRETVERMLAGLLPSQLAEADFPMFERYGAYAGHLTAVRQHVVEWSRAIVNQGICNAPSFYLFGTPGPWGTGNGCGKSHLAAASFKYIGRRTAYFNKAPGNFKSIGASCIFLSVEKLVEDFRAAKGSRVDPTYGVQTDDGWEDMSFDQYRKYLAQADFLFMDDVGCRQGSRMVQETYEYILDFRAEEGWPVFMTSNFSPDDLADRIGGRALSRIFRGNGCDVVQVKAPDYPRLQEGWARR